LNASSLVGTTPDPGRLVRAVPQKSKKSAIRKNGLLDLFLSRLDYKDNHGVGKLYY
jgi:hypothetical protein